MEDSSHPSHRRRHLHGIDLEATFQSNSQEILQKTGCKACLIAKSLVDEVHFTTAELEICFGLLIGLSAKEIAKYRDCSNRTVENHIANIKGKLNINQISPLMLANIFDMAYPSTTPKHSN
jgi:DNA-binding NarL/FixJ family response regulator